MEVNPSITYATTADGRVVLTSTPLHSNLILTVEGMGYRPESGGLAAGAFHSMVNKEFEVHIGDNAFFLRFIRMTIKDENYDGAD
jgi:hypothetical protein